MIEFKNVSYRYDQSEYDVLNQLSLSIHNGEWVSVIGQNGSGKSTLVKLLMGVYEKYDGEILYNGEPLNNHNGERIRRNFAIVFQNPDNQFVGATVEDDVAFGLENHGVPREEMIRRVDDSLKAVGMEHFKQHEPSRLSGGQKQRVAIAGAISLQPEVLIFDEATSMLDPSGRRDVLNILKNIHEQSNTTIIYITHDLSEITNSDQVVVINHGQIKFSGQVEDLFKQVDILEECRLILPLTMQLSHELLDGKMISYDELVDAL